MDEISRNNLSILIKDISNIIKSARSNAFTAVNREMLKAYYEIGRRIVEEEQRGDKRAAYGKKVLETISARLEEEFERGFDTSNLRRMRNFYILYKKWETVSPKLSWSHYCELIKIKDDVKRGYYQKYIAEGSLSVRDLKRQMNTFHYERMIHKNPIPLDAEDIIKDPYVLEFINAKNDFREKDIESGIIENLQKFLLELGQGFTFVARQKKINAGNKSYYIDLLFYNTYLKCYVAVEIKKTDFDHKDAGQMNFYLNHISKELNGENKPIGLILCKHKDRIKAEYATLGISHKVFVSRYMLYLPAKKEVEKMLLEN